MWVKITAGVVAFLMLVTMTLAFAPGLILVAGACSLLEWAPGADDCEGYAGPSPGCNNPSIDDDEGGGGGDLPAGEAEFVMMYVDQAYAIGKQYGIPYDAMLAQAALESGWGGSSLTTEAMNFFGIKAGSGWSGPVYEVETKEQRADGSWYTVVAEFRKYADARAGFQGYAQFIHENSRYAEALKYPQDPVQYITEIREAGYATDLEYVDKVVGIMEGVRNAIADQGKYPPSEDVVPDAKPPDTGDDQTGGDGSNSCRPSGDMAAVIEIAHEEEAKNVKENPAGSNSGGRVDVYTGGNPEHWCADFVSWVFNEAGSPFTGGWRFDWQLPGVSGMQDWFQDPANGAEYFEVGDETPQPGDVAFYIGAQTPDQTSTSHVNIVIEVAEDGKTMTTIGGNESDAVTEGNRSIALGADALVGFGRMP